jgi:hypothetical protein
MIAMKKKIYKYSWRLQYPLSKNDKPERNYYEYRRTQHHPYGTGPCRPVQSNNQLQLGRPSVQVLLAQIPTAPDPECKTGLNDLK